MPIKPENRARYPKDWSVIRTAIKARANHRCEWPGCGVLNHSVGFWLGGRFVMMPLALRDAGYKPGDRVPTAEGERIKIIRIVLTVAHLDHTPENCDPANLAAWCQRHHLAYDQAHHTTNAYMTRKARANTQELPL